MIEWLQNFSGLKTSGLNMERIELESLRKEMSKYQKKYEKTALTPGCQIKLRRANDTKEFFALSKISAKSKL